MKFSSQKGFTLLEVSIATAIAALGIMATLQMRAAQSQIDAARSVAQVYERLNNAAGSYMTIFYSDIINKARISPACGTPAYQIRTENNIDAVNHGSDCKIELEVNKQKHTINNYLQPTPSELAKLGLLTATDGRYEDQLPLPSFALAGGSASTSMVAYNTSLDPGFGPSNSQARNGMAILIQLMCIGANPPVTSPVLSLNTCSTNKYDLRSLVFNIQPYTNIGDGNTLLYRVMEAAGGGRTYLSDTRFDGELRADGGVSTLDNPIKIQNTNTGSPFILAIRNGYGSAGLDVFVRRDGSKTLTSDWGVGDFSITGINTLSANNVAANYVGTNDILTNSATVTGALSAGSVVGNSVRGVTGVFGNFLGELRAALNATTAYFSGNVTADGELTVAGATKLNSGLSVEGGTKVADFLLKNEAKLGDACNPKDQTLVRASNSSAGFNDTGLRMLVCDPATSKWTRAQADYAPQIAEINTAILNLGGQIGGINSSISGINSSISGIGGINDTLTDYRKRLAKVEDEYMTWDFINVTWTPVNVKGETTSKVWRRTPFICANIGGNVDGSGVGLPDWDQDPNIRFKKHASLIQKGKLGSSYTPPIFIGFDNTPEEDVVYDINCENDYWHVGISTKASNKKGGNICRDGLIRPTVQVIVNGTLDWAPCKDQPFNLNTPSYNKQTMAARFITFTRKP